MAHVTFKCEGPNGRETLTVDGMDLSRVVAREGLTFWRDGYFWVVELRLIADQVDVDLPEAVVEAMISAPADEEVQA